MRKLLLFIIVIFIAIVAMVGYKENYLNMPFSKDYNHESCWNHIKQHFPKWNLDNFSEKEKKVLFTMRKLNANLFEDDNKYFPGWEKKCVIPATHLPIFNKANDKHPWDIQNNPPDRDSPSYMRYTNKNEYPQGYVIDLTKHNERSFKKMLNSGYELYDKEFFDEKKRLEEEIKRWRQIKIQKQRQLEIIKNEIQSVRAKMVCP